MASRANARTPSIGEDVAALRRDLAVLMDHLKSGAVNGAGTMAQDVRTRVADEASELYGRLAEEGARSFRAVGRQVEEQPVTSLLIAFAAGFIGGRFLAR